MGSWADLDQFKNWLRNEGLTGDTAEAYATDAAEFLTGAGDVSAKELPPERVAGWLDDLAEAGYAPTTIARRLTSLRRFCRWLMASDELPCDPTDGISVDVCGDEDRPEAAGDVVAAVLVAPDPLSPIGIRDRAMMALLANTGMELRELCALELADCSLDARQLIVGSGRRLRRLHLSSAQRPLRRYLYQVREKQAGEALFLSNRGRRISERAVQHRVRHHAAEAEVDVTVADLIELGRRRRASGDPKHAARELGFARPDAVRRRYGLPEGDTKPAPADHTPPHPFLEPIDGTSPGAMPAPPGQERPASGRADLWARLEAGCTRASGARAASAVRAVAQAGELSRRVAGILGDETTRAACASDTGLLLLREHVLAASPDLQMWSRLHARYPAVRAQVKETADRPGLYENGWPDAALAMLTFGSPQRVIECTKQVLAAPEAESLVWALVAGQWEQLSRLRQCAIEYYDLPASAAARSDLDAALVVAGIAGLVLCEPSAVERGRVSQVVEEPAVMYFLDTVTVVLYQLLRLLGHAVEAAPLSEIEDDRLFVRAFEREWDRLLPHTNGFFGFAVVPRLSYEDMVRYHWLRYKPYGRLDSIPYEVGDYLVHQAKGSMHFLRPFLPDQVQDAFYDCVRPLYSPLLESIRRKAEWALTQKHQEQDRDEILDRAQQETEAAFREAYDRYDFYHHPPGREQTQICCGLLGWRRRSDLQELGGALGIACEEVRTPFAAYARGALLRLIKRLRRESIGKSQGVRVQAPDSRGWFYTINRMARRFRRSAPSLRRLDDVLKPQRVSEVFGEHRMGRRGLPGTARLYPADADSLEEYQRILDAGHPRLEAEGLRTEKEVAEWLDVEVWWLRSRRDQGLLEADRRGHFVVYDAEQRIVARDLLEQERGDRRER